MIQNTMLDALGPFQTPTMQFHLLIKVAAACLLLLLGLRDGFQLLPFISPQVNRSSSITVHPIHPDQSIPIVLKLVLEAFSSPLNRCLLLELLHWRLWSRKLLSFSLEELICS